MKLLAALTALALAGAAPCAAQSQVVQSGPKQLSPEQSRVQNGIMLLRDSVLAAESALRQFERDYEKASPITLESWARDAAGRCAAAGRTLPVARELVKGASFTSPDMSRSQKDLLSAMDKAGRTLGSCGSTFKPLGESGKGEEVRAYGNHRAVPLLKDLQKYDAAVQQAVKSMQLDVRTVVRAGKAPI